MQDLYLNTTYSGGGAEKVTRQIYEGMKARGQRSMRLSVTIAEGRWKTIM